MRPLTLGIVAFFIIIAGYLVWQMSSFGIFEMGKPLRNIESHNIVLEKVEQIGKLELVKFKFKDVVEYTKEYKAWVRNSKVVLIVSGEAVGCLDLKKIKKEDIDDTRKDSLYIRLPEPELCYYKINQGETRIYDSAYGFTDGATVMGEAYKKAEEKMRTTALESGILQQTRTSGETMLKALFESITKKKVFFTTAPKPKTSK